MKTPNRGLTPFPLQRAIDALSGGEPGARVVTMTAGQWDDVLASLYEAGWTLLELDANERPVRAYRAAKADGRSEHGNERIGDVTCSDT